MDFNTALSGLQAISNQLSVISNNIANTSTTGFKSARTQFADVYATNGGSNPIGAGVTLASVTQNFSQGQIEFTNNNLDLAISGNGFFVLSNNGVIAYTRAGAFGTDKNGFIINSLGDNLQGYLADSSGNITGAQGNLQISNASLPPKATANLTVDVNLDAQATPPVNPFVMGFTPSSPPQPSTFNSSTSATIYDSLGNSHIITSYYVKAPEQNTWRVHVGIDGTDVTPAAATPPAGVPPVRYPTGALASPFTLVFNSSGGYIANNSASPPTYYGPGPVVNTTPGLVTAGTLSGLSLNNLTINDVAIPATLASSDIVSTSDNAASAIALAAAINQNSTTDGVTATPNPTSVSLGAPTFGNLGAGNFSINGVPIVGTSGNIVQLLGLINAQTASTGVSAAQPGGAGTAVILTANDGRNVQIQTNGTAGGASFANFLLSGGAALNEVERSTVSLTSSGNQAIIIGGNNPAQVGFSSGPQAGIIQTNSDVVAITGWTPAGGAAGPQIVTLNLGSSTQYGAPFSIFGLQQDGYSTGQLSSVNIENSGIMVGQYSNGQSLALGQIALANFTNEQGLAPIGNTTWSQTFNSGTALIGQPGTASLGVIQSGALEDSNVQLTNELVNLIVAQSNFQANAQSIKTVDTVTQTIINL